MKFYIAALLVLILTGCDSRFAQYQAFTVKVTPGNDGYSAQTMPCPAMDITPMGAVYEGCAVENSRYQSMVNPEKMLPEYDMVNKAPPLNKKPQPNRKP